MGDAIVKVKIAADIAPEAPFKTDYVKVFRNQEGDKKTFQVTFAAAMPDTNTKLYVYGGAAAPAAADEPETLAGLKILSQDQSDKFTIADGDYLWCRHSFTVDGVKALKNKVSWAIVAT
jgi:hypothetical protein